MATAELPDIAEIEESFAFFDDWESRFEYVLDLAKRVPPMPADEKVDANKVMGCQASVWMAMHVPREPSPHVELHATSDAHIVNGLIAILLSLYNGKSPGEALRTDAEAFFKKLGLEEHLSPTRRNGLHSMLQRVRTLAKAHAAAEEAGR